MFLSPRISLSIRIWSLALALHLGAHSLVAAPAQDSIVSGGKRVRIELFEPAGKGTHSALVLLHGLDGMEKGGKTYRFIAGRLASRGYVVSLVHYLDRTGTTKEELPRLLEQFRAVLRAPTLECEHVRPLRECFAAWLETANDAIVHLRKHWRVDPDRIGLVGISMGGYLATATAARPTLRIRCVAELFGGLPHTSSRHAEHMPATLIVHGEGDEIVPLSEARRLEKLLREAGRRCETRLYKEVGHCFVGKDGKVDFLASLDAEKQAVAFLASHLARPVAQKSASSTIR